MFFMIAILLYGLQGSNQRDVNIAELWLIVTIDGDRFYDQLHEIMAIEYLRDIELRYSSDLRWCASPRA